MPDAERPDPPPGGGRAPKKTPTKTPILLAVIAILALAGIAALTAGQSERQVERGEANVEAER